MKLGGAAVVLVLAACGGSTSSPVAQPNDAGSPSSPIDAGGPTNPVVDGGQPSDAGVADAVAPADCLLSQASNLTGVAVKFTAPGCTFTLAQAKAGISIAYELDIADDVPNVVPGGQSSAPSLGPSGLQLFEQLSGNGQNYCLCDTGLGVGLPQDPETLKKGVYASTFTWDGHNWNGPSDTGNPKGAYFPAGDYELEVSTIGKKSGVPFTVQAHFLVRLVP